MCIWRFWFAHAHCFPQAAAAAARRAAREQQEQPQHEPQPQFALEDAPGPGPAAPAAQAIVVAGPAPQRQTQIAMQPCLRLATTLRPQGDKNILDLAAEAGAGAAHGAEAERGKDAALSPSLLSEYRYELEQKSVSRVYHDFKKKTQPSRTEPSVPFPPKVTYQRACQSCCLNHGPTRRRAFYLSSLKAFKDCADFFGSASTLASVGVILGIEVFKDRDSDQPDDRVFTNLALASSQAGPSPPTQTFLQMACTHPLLPDSFEDLVLTWPCHEHVQPERQPRPPLHLASTGPLQGMTEDETAFHLVSLFDRDGAVASCVDKVVIRQLKYKDRSLHEVITQGPDPSFDPIVVLAPLDGGAIVAAGGRGRGRRGGGRGRGDLLAIFDREPHDPVLHPRPAAQRQRPAAPRRADENNDDAWVNSLVEELGLNVQDQSDAADPVNMLRSMCSPEEALTVEAILDELQRLDDEDLDGEEQAEPAGAGQDGAGERNEPGDAAGDGDGAAEAAGPEPEAAEADPLVCEGGGVYVDRTGNRVGRIHWIGQSSVKATCHIHRSCNCWLTKTPNGRDQAVQDLETWFREALGGPGPGAAGATAGQHDESATELKISYGMRIKRRRV